MWNNIDKLKDDTSLCSYLFFIFVGGGEEEWARVWKLASRYLISLATDEKLVVEKGRKLLL